MNSAQMSIVYYGNLKVKVTLRPTTSRSVSPGFKAHLGLTTGYLFLLTFTILSIAGAPSDERSGLSFAIVIIRPLLVNIYRIACNVHVSDIYEYIQYVQGLCQSRLRTADHALS
jgi:hypothetical protein